MFTFNSDLGDAIKFVSKIEKNKKVYVSNSIKEPYIYFLFYKKYNTSNFINSVKYKKCNKCQFQEVLSFGNYYFIKIDKIEKPGIYILYGINGSGKSTIIKMITGIIYKTSGELKIDS